MERRQEVQQEPVYKYDENNSRWLKGMELPDGNFYVQEVAEDEVPAEAFASLEAPIVNAAPTESSFELSFRASGPARELPSIMEQFGARFAPNYDYAQPALDAPMASPLPEYSYYEDAIDRYNEVQDDDRFSELDVLVPPSLDNPQIEWNGVDEDDDNDMPALRGIERRGKAHSRKSIVFGIFALVALGVTIDGVHALGEVKNDMAHTSSCPVGTCIPGNFLGDMLPPFGHSEPAKTTEKGQK